MEHVQVAGEAVPALGLGTWQLRGDECVRAVDTALDIGYRHIDTAEYYGNQAAIGRAIAGSSVDRDELFITTKVWRSNLAADAVRRVAEDALEKLRTDYVDLLLIHWPNESVPVAETLGAMNALQHAGKVRHVGVSNFSIAQVREAMAASETPILTDQVEYNPYDGRPELLEFCLDEGVMLTAYSPLAKGRVIDDGTLARIGERYDKTAAQVALRWLVQQELVAAIPKASTRAHLAANFEVFDFELDAGEMAAVFELSGGLVDRLRSALGI